MTNQITIDKATMQQIVGALSDIKYGLEGSRIWGGVEWTYNPLHHFKYLPLRDKAEEAIAAARAAIQSAQPVAPYECKTQDEKLAYAAGWWKALESVHIAARGIKEAK